MQSRAIAIVDELAESASIQRDRRTRLRRRIDPVTPTDRDLDVLDFIYDFSVAVTPQIAALFFEPESTAVYRRLQTLTDGGLLARVRPVARGRGSWPWIYQLTTPGWETLRSAGRAIDGDGYQALRLTGTSYVEHDLAVVSLLVSLAAATAQLTGRQDGGLLRRSGIQPIGPRRGRVDTRRRTRPLGAPPGSELPDGAAVRPGASLPGVIEPDLTLPARVRDGRSTAVLIEYDRTRRPSKQTRRLRRYDYLLTVGWRESRYATLELEPLALLICDTPGPLAAFATATDSQLTAAVTTPQAPTRYPGRELLGISTRQRLLAHDWGITQPPTTPGGARRSDDFRHTTLNLPALLADAAG